MIRFAKSITLSVAAAALLSACSRPMATFQASKPMHYYSPSGPMVSTETGNATPEVTAGAHPEQPNTTLPTPTEQVAPALASLKATYATDKRMTRRLARIEQQLTENRAAPVNIIAQKTSLVQRLVLKKMAKQMQRKLAPNQATDIAGPARLGLIIAGVGLLLLIIGNAFFSILGLIALLAGGALFVYSLLQE
ncbi:hypothetical protein [Fibrella aquatilis]|uniref:Uncharacterized protein n=1 Tax=Fibrella aquatilis TaxID=2817059 RepID=A0A939G489_9BACT|nr:hypothetical protein [Fibrella aquatilis]MBO0929523.1 hypothetical protein [Fibrella aquatilis]